VARHYQPRGFLRHAPNRLLQQYFTGRRVLAVVDFGALTEPQIEPIYEAWLLLPEEARNEMEQDFQEIDDLATEADRRPFWTRKLPRQGDTSIGELLASSWAR